EFPRDLVLVARILEMPAAQGTLESTWLAAKGGLEEGMAQDSGAGATLRSIAGEGSSLQALLLNPRVVGLSLSLLPALLNEAGLRKQGLSVAEARSLLGPGIVAASTSLLEVINALRRLDLLSSLSASVLPVERHSGQWVSDGTPIRAPLLELLSPGSLDEATHGHVVGATLGELAAGLSSHAMALPALGALRKFWQRMGARAQELNGRTVEGGPPFLAVFSNAVSAGTFEEELRAGLDNLRLDMGPFGQLQLSGSANVATAEGPLAGGWSGDVVVVQGPPVEAVFSPERSVSSVWEEPGQPHDGPTGPIMDPFAPTPVSVEDDAQPPDDWSSLSDLVGDTGELPFVDPGESNEDLGEAVSYDLLGAFELAGRDDPEVDRLLEPYSQDIIPDGEPVLSDSLDCSLSEDLLDGRRPSIPVEHSEPSLPDNSMDSDQEFELSGNAESLLAEYTESTMESLDQEFSTEPPFSTGAPPPIEMPAPFSDEEDEGAAFDVEIEDDEDDDSELDDSGTIASGDDLLGATDDLSFEDEGEDDFADMAPDIPLSNDGEGFFLPPPEPSQASLDDSGDVDWKDGMSRSVEIGEPLLSPGQALGAMDFLEESSLDREWDDDLPTSAGSEAPVFPDLGLDLDLEEPDMPFDSEPSSPSQSAISRRDLDFLFQGYVVVRTEGAMIFGRSYGTTLVDVHRYDIEQTQKAYLSFAKDKIRERFSPSSDATWTLSGRDRADPLSLDQMMMAFEEAQGE
ncbi:MAG: hypothetical protein ACI9VR_004099, partial [Cognaticolwellia sp.]